jgi:hypothetical protein
MKLALVTFGLPIFFSFSLAACTQALPPSVPADTNDQVNQLISAVRNTQSYRAQITVKTKAVEKTYTLDNQSPDLIQTEAHTPKGIQTFIYQAQNIFVNNPGDKLWYKLTIAKKDPARTFGGLNLGGWQEQPASLAFQSHTPCGQDTCSLYYFTDNTSAVHKLLFSDKNFLLASHHAVLDGQEIAVNYLYPVINHTVPSAYTDYHFPKEPTDKDLQLIQAIYNF